jgi:hypothetical protein
LADDNPIPATQFHHDEVSSGDNGSIICGVQRNACRKDKGRAGTHITVCITEDAAVTVG